MSYKTWHKRYRHALAAEMEYGYSRILRNCFPGICLTIPFISISHSDAKTSDEFNSVFSSSSSTWIDSSVSRRANILFSTSDSALSNKDARSALEVASIG